MQLQCAVHRTTTAPFLSKTPERITCLCLGIGVATSPQLEAIANQGQTKDIIHGSGQARLPAGVKFQNLGPNMLSAARTALRPKHILTRSLAVRAASVHTLPPLPYAYNALEPHICEEIMKLHHTKHHQTYVNGLNAAEEAYSKTDDIRTKISLQSALKFNGGGHINHSLFWNNLSPTSEHGGKLGDGPLKDEIAKAFGSVEEFKKKFNATTAAIQGSGWGWLGWDTSAQRLEIITTANQDPLISHIPILGIDIWEHAFYIQYKNVKPDYLNAIWNVVNFEEAEQRLLAAAKK